MQPQRFRPGNDELPTSRRIDITSLVLRYRPDLMAHGGVNTAPKNGFRKVYIIGSSVAATLLTVFGCLAYAYYSGYYGEIMMAYAYYSAYYGEIMMKPSKHYTVVNISEILFPNNSFMKGIFDLIPFVIFKEE